MISQGTISVFFGCHSIVMHSLLVIMAWKRLYGRYPQSWQVVCIILHDIGHLGLNYLDDYEAKKTHWRLGARIATLLFGQQGFDFVAGHCEYSGVSLSALHKADKYSWSLAPSWWLYTNTLTEPKLRMGYSRRDAVLHFQAQVRQNIESGAFRSTHTLFLERCQSTPIPERSMAVPDMTIEQVSIALAKLYIGTGPGDDMWCELDYQAVEYAVGHPVERRRTRFDPKIDVALLHAVNSEESAPGDI